MVRRDAGGYTLTAVRAGEATELRAEQLLVATAVVSLVTPAAPASVRASFCNRIHFFVSAEAAQDWLAEHPDARILPVAGAYETGRPLIEQALAGTPAADCC
ncbi:organomercurial lyase [Streptomyces sp. P17]|uniref:organomercurial lyase n=1 Tax=Streptomyces sp. P17 TaxID=3074716 RepID=UPI0028F3E4E1|nr:organomercurial lyase [Streptomyces sp. P17]MDT9698076.1 organomercurial lyase [Streptomyces sp. P17]